MNYANQNDQGKIAKSPASKPANAARNFASMTEAEIYEHLEIKYGPYFALNIVDEIRKAQKHAA